MEAVSLSGPPRAESAAAQAGKFLTFSLAEEDYGFEITRVQEIVGLIPVTRVPRLPAFVAGVVNLRGRVIPVLDLRLAFGMAKSEMGERTCIIVVNVTRAVGGESVVGVIVDEVSDVVFLGRDVIEPTPEFGTAVDTSFINGVGRMDGRVVMLLDIDRVLTSRELDDIERAAVADAAPAGTNEKEL